MSEYWKKGTEIINACLQGAIRADPSDVPFPLTGEDAKLWHRASASAYQHALEMMGYVPSQHGTLDHAIDLAIAETSRAREKHGDFIERYDDYRRSPVLVEEVGEVADVLNELSLGNLTRDQATERLIAELAQVASVALRWTSALLAGDAPPGFKRCKTPGCSVVMVDDASRDACPVCSDRNFKEHQAQYIKEMSAMMPTGDTATVICATDGCGAIMRDSKHDRCSTCRGASPPVTHPPADQIACATNGCSITVRDMTSKYCPPCRSARSGHGL